MSFLDFEESIAKLKDITNAREYKEENKALKEELRKKEQEYQLMLGEQNKKISILDKCVNDLEAIRIKYDKKSYSLKAFDAIVGKKFNEKIKQEIEMRVEKKWDMEGPKLTSKALQEEITNYPHNCSLQIRKLIDSKTLTERNKILKNKNLWPQWFQKLYKSEVEKGISKGLDAEFFSKVNNSAQDSLRELVNFAWPRYVQKISNQFFNRPFIEQLMNLQNPILLTCDKCGTDYEVILSRQNVADLLKKPVIKISCTTDGCRDFIGPHGIPLTLAEVILQIEKPIYYMKAVKQETTEEDTKVCIF